METRNRVHCLQVNCISIAHLFFNLVFLNLVCCLVRNYIIVKHYHNIKSTANETLNLKVHESFSLIFSLL